MELEHLLSVLIWLLGFLFCEWDLGLNSVELGSCVKGILDGLINALS